MQIKMLATGIAPDYYTIEGDTITAHVGEESATYELAGFPEGAHFQGVEPIADINPIRHIERTDGELYVTLCQRVGAGHWLESNWFDAATFDPDAVYAQQDTSKDYAGEAAAWTRQGRVVMEEASNG